MKIGVVGLGRMGGNIARRLMRAGHTSVVFDRDERPRAALAADGAVAVASLSEMVGALDDGPRVVWLMLPAGEITEAAVMAVADLMVAGDIIIDGGNAFYKDDVRRARTLAERGIRYVDVGTSGGVWGLDRGYCLMVGGTKDAVDFLDPIFVALAPGKGSIEPTPGRDGLDPKAELGYIHCGPSGSGRFVKMIHNGIEYGLMQAYAEGFDILRNANSDSLPEEHRFDFNLPDIAEVWRRGSVIGSWLLDLSAIAFAKDHALDGYSGVVDDSGEGRWTVMAAIEEAVPADVLSAALYSRFRSREKDRIADKLLSAMRHQFGGHVEPKKGS